jgi:hypothetical protein
MGLFGKKSAGAAGSGGNFKRADGSLVQISPEEFNADPELQLEFLTVSLMDDVVKGLTFLPNAPFSREELHAAVTRLATIAMRGGDVELTTTLWRVCAECTRLDDMTMTDLGEFVFDTATWVYEFRTRFAGSGDDVSELALSMLGTMAHKVIETRNDYQAVMQAVQEAAGRAR